MYLLYVDESGDPGPSGSAFLILGAASLFEGKWLALERDLRHLQLADLAAYGLWRLVTAKDSSIARIIFPLFDREPTTSRMNPGKWHGVKYLGNDGATRAILDAVWL